MCKTVPGCGIAIAAPRFWSSPVCLLHCSPKSLPEHLPRFSLLLKAHGWEGGDPVTFCVELLFASKRGRILFALCVLIYTNIPLQVVFFCFYKWNCRDILALLRGKYFLFLNAVYCLCKTLRKVQMPLGSPRRSLVRAFYLRCGA